MQNELHCVRKRTFENEFSRNIILFRFNLILNCLNSINLTLSHLKFSKKKPRDQYWLKFKLNKIGFPRNLFCTLLYSLSQISDVATKLRSSFLRPTHGNFIRMKRGFILLHFFTTAVLAELPMKLFTSPMSFHFLSRSDSSRRHYIWANFKARGYSSKQI